MRGYVPDESVGLIYLDPPLNSRQLYNLHRGQRGEVAGDAARIFICPL